MAAPAPAAAAAGPDLAGTSSEAVSPWDAIKGGWEREAVRMWWNGHDKGRIAKHLGKDPKTVENRFSNLRRTLGTDIVPHVNDPRRAHSHKPE